MIYSNPFEIYSIQSDGNEFKSISTEQSMNRQLQNKWILWVANEWVRVKEKNGKKAAAIWIMFSYIEKKRKKNLSEKNQSISDRLNAYSEKINGLKQKYKFVRNQCFHSW